MGIDTIKGLVNRFSDHLEEYKSPSYNETQVRRDFIDPFFEALGWDINNRQGYSQTFRQVIHEDSLNVEGSTKAPDYCFQLGGRRVFFVEAKKPAVDLKEDMHPAYQLRRYAWSARLPVSILTDFEEFAVYDCRVKPTQTDKASAARVLYLPFNEYPARWDELIGLFSPEAIQKGSIEKYVGSAKLKRGTAQVDDAFLEEIEGWRELLAKSIALRNPDLLPRDLNFAVQRTIDRVIFLRICEDRGIETYATLQEFLNGANIYERLVEYFRRADERYNSGLFHFRDEKEQSETPDTLTPRIKIDDKPLKDILKSLYYPDCPYEFSVLGADILGSVYERFLGKVIRLTAGHRAVVEDKPEVRKAGGVYYTPTYIVDYIVKNTVGKILEGKTSKQAAELRILDPACGSGSFLLGAYQCLLGWHAEQYIKDPEKWSKGKDPALYKSHEGDWKLTTQERKRILLNNIYGVDIDSQAVEVTKLSLLLKVLEGESGETISKQLKLFHQRALPDLGSNIKCGNSLIGPDFYQQQRMADLTDEDYYRINVFDWNQAFPEIMKRGGFDAVIGNPPYGAQFEKESEAYIRKKFLAVTNSLDSFIMFVEQAGNLLNPQGHFGMIIPLGWVSTPSSKKLRERFAEQFRPTSFVSLPYDVFDGAYIDTIIVTAQRIKSGMQWSDLKITTVDLIVFPIRRKVESQMDFDAFRKVGNFGDWIASPDKEFLVLSSQKQAALVKKLRESPAKYDSVVQVMRGIETYHPRPAKDCRKSKRAFNGDMLRYELDLGAEAYEGYPPDIEAGKPIKFFSGQRILLRQLISRKFRLQAVYTDEEFLTNQSIQSLIPRNAFPNIKCVLAILNSRLISWFFCQFNMVSRRDDFPKTIIKQTRELPFPSIDIKKIADKSRHDRLVMLAESMMALTPKLRRAKSEPEKSALQNTLNTNEAEIDQLVYELYGLTDEEIKIVEGK